MLIYLVRCTWPGTRASSDGSGVTYTTIKGRDAADRPPPVSTNHDNNIYILFRGELQCLYSERRDLLVSFAYLPVV